MILIKVQVQNFKSIVNSGEVDIESKLTILIGKNEQGKSNYLKALQSFNEDYKYLPSDLPNHLRPNLEQRSPEVVPVVTLWLQLTSDDLEELKNTIEHIDKVKYLKVIKSYNNGYNISVIKQDNTESKIEFIPPDISSQIEQFKTTAGDLKVKLMAHATRSPEFATNKDQAEQLIGGFLNANFSETNQVDNLVKTFSTGIRALPGQDTQVQVDITTATKNLESILTKITQILKDDQADNNKSMAILKRLPKFIFHSTSIDKIPDGVSVAEFISAPEKVSLGMLKLCKAAGLSIQKIQELAKTTSVPDREVFEDHYEGYISGGLNEFWTQEKYKVHFRIEKEGLSVSISDSTYRHRLPPSQRSEGFQWYLSFYSTIQNESASSLATIILLDNPALELHVDGQRDIKKFLEDKIAPHSQIIYVTHSPAMIDPFKIEQIRTVELNSSDGTISEITAYKNDDGELYIVKPIGKFKDEEKEYKEKILFVINNFY